MEELIAKRYVKALLEVISTEQKSSFGEVLNSISSLFSDGNIIEKINSPLISSSDKTAFILEAIPEDNISMVNFIKILGENNRLNLIPTIASSLNQELQKERNEYEGIVTSSNELDGTELTDLENSLKTYTGSTIKLTQQKSDLDGIKVTVDDLGIEVNFSKQRVKEQLIDFITKSI
ncbi:MAG TPA: F0F1 ATP synthase subunit delta [Campylobacterales bacterium]|nr:F0F1 ATP synthase subunit delta [Campylobacterales bacterium]HHH51182.1 F0F1 ATP synthase subunit delta [Campylobacterales bacterium]